MNRQLPDRANLDHLKKQAKELLAAIKAEEPEPLSAYRAAFQASPPTLAKAQLLTARSYGFSSWAELLRAIRAREKPAAVQFVDLAMGGQIKKAAALWARHREDLRKDPSAAATAGDADAVLEAVRANPQLLNEPTGPKDRPLLTYVCFSRLIGSRAFGAGIRKTAGALLDIGADPNGCFIAKWGDSEWRQTPLYGAAGVLNDPELTKMLIDAGADPSDGEADAFPYRGETVYHACDFPRHNECLALVLDAGASQNAKDYCICRKLDFDDPEGVKVFLDRGANPNCTKGRTALSHAVLRGRSNQILKLLIESGADPNLKGGDGMSAYVTARRLGDRRASKFLEEHGAVAEFEPYDAILIAAADGDEARVRELASRHPEVVSRFSNYGRQANDGMSLGSAGEVLHDMARLGNVAGLRVLLDLGYPADLVNPSGESPLHWAAAAGRTEAARLLLARGARIDAVEKNHGSDPLGWAIWGSANWQDPQGRYGETVQALLEAGASAAGRSGGSKEVRGVLSSFART